jgi:hypothetical protein
MAQQPSPTPKPSQNPASPQADGNSEPIHQVDKQSGNRSDSADEHIGATEDEVSETSAPAGPEYEDEPKQG